MTTPPIYTPDDIRDVITAFEQTRTRLTIERNRRMADRILTPRAKITSLTAMRHLVDNELADMIAVAAEARAAYYTMTVTLRSSLDDDGNPDDTL